MESPRTCSGRGSVPLAGRGVLPPEKAHPVNVVMKPTSFEGTLESRCLWRIGQLEDSVGEEG